MSLAIHAAWSPGDVRIAVRDADGLLDYAIWRPGSPDGLGDVHIGRVTASVPAMAGAFVALTDTEGFLPDTEGARGLTLGALVTVRVIRTAQGGKGPRLSARGVPPEAGPAGLRHSGLDPLRTLAARHAGAPVCTDDAALAAALRADLGARVSLVAHAFDDAIEAEVETVLSPEMVLPSGARMTFHPTPALVAIDVDAGGALAGQDGAARRHRAINAQVIPVLARQIRLRNISGAVLVDFAGLRPKQRPSLAGALTAALADDPSRPRLLGFTALGLAEIVRPRERAPLHEMTRGPLAAGLTLLRALAGASRAEPGRRFAVRAAPAVLAALERDRVGLEQLAHATGRRLNARAAPELAPEAWLIDPEVA